MITLVHMSRIFLKWRIFEPHWNDWLVKWEPFWFGKRCKFNKINGLRIKHTHGHQMARRWLHMALIATGNRQTKYRKAFNNMITFPPMNTPMKLAMAIAAYRAICRYEGPDKDIDHEAALDTACKIAGLRKEWYDTVFYADCEPPAEG